MADLFAVANAKIFIGQTLAAKTTDFVEADFDSISWTEIDGWETAGAFGDTAQVITTQLINRGRDQKQKGTRNAGQMQNNFAFVEGDEGQTELIAAEKATDNYAFKIEWDDSLGANPTTHFFIALVMNVSHAGGDANTVRMLNSTLEINSNVVEKAAA